MIDIKKIKGIRAFYLAYKKYQLDESVLHSSALTYYCLLALVPLLAVILAIARGFGLEVYVNTQLHAFLAHQTEILDYALDFAKTLLSEAKSGILVGSGIAILLWSVVHVFLHIEKIFNTIWRSKSEKPIAYRVGQGAILTFLAPIFLVCLSSVLINIEDLLKSATIHHIFMPIVPLLSLSLLFALIYFLFPAARISFRAAWIGGIFASVCFLTMQWLLLSAQLVTVKHNVVYGSFAVLPIFLLWLKLSWVIIIYFAQFVFILQYKITDTWQFDMSKLSYEKKRKIAFSIFEACQNESRKEKVGLSI